MFHQDSVVAAIGFPIRRWRTSSQGGTTSTTPADLASLGRHLVCCKRPREWALGLKGDAEQLYGFVAGHVVSTLALIALAAVVAYRLS